MLGGGVSAAAVVAVGGRSETRTVTAAAPAASSPKVSTPAVVQSAPAAAPAGGSDAIAQIYRQAAPGVVRVTQAQGQGSGFVIDTDGYILTNAHVVDANGPVYVSFSNNDRAEAKIIGTDPSTDVALLKVDTQSDALRPIPLGSSSSVGVGDPVVAIGNPFGLDRTITSGIVSAIGRQISSPNDSPINGAIQTDAAINHGNSGGPLLNMKGEVIGINSQIAQSGVNANVGVGFAIPIDTVKAIADDLRAHGSVKHAWLGVGLSPVDDALANRIKLPVTRGAMVRVVEPGSPAAAGGLRGATNSVVLDGETYAIGGDIVTAIDGATVASTDDLQTAIQAKRAGDSVTLSVVHADGTKAQVSVTLGTRPTAPVQQAQQQTPQVDPFGYPLQP